MGGILGNVNASLLGGMTTHYVAFLIIIGSVVKWFDRWSGTIAPEGAESSNLSISLLDFLNLYYLPK